MKKFLAVFLLAAMLLMLAACGNSGAGTDTPGGDNIDVFPEFKVANTTQEVLTAENGCTVTVAPLAYVENIVELEVTLNNPTEETKVLDLVGLRFNDMMLDVYLSIEAKAGECKEDSVWLSKDELRSMGISQIASVELLMKLSDDNWNVEEALTYKQKTDAADSYVADPMAYANAFTSEKAQKLLQYQVKDSVDTRTALGGEVYVESTIYVDREHSSDELLLEVVNEDTQMRYVGISADTVNGMMATGAGEYYTIFPGARAVISIDLDWALSETMREAFGVKEFSSIELSTEVYACNPDGSMDMESEGEYEMLGYTVPDTTAVPDMSGTVLYEENGLKITAKAPVDAIYEEGDKQTYVYLIFENVSQFDIELEENYEKEVIIDGDEKNYYFQHPGFLYMGDQVICYVAVDNMEGNYIFLPLIAEDSYDSENCWEVDLHILF